MDPERWQRISEKLTIDNDELVISEQRIGCVVYNDSTGDSRRNKGHNMLSYRKSSTKKHSESWLIVYSKPGLRFFLLKHGKK